MKTHHNSMEPPTLEEACNSVASLYSNIIKHSNEGDLVTTTIDRAKEKCTIDVKVPFPGSPGQYSTYTTSFVNARECTGNDLCLLQTFGGSPTSVQAKFSKSSSGEIYIAIPK